MIGDIEHDKKVYYVHNFDKMKDDFARGTGDYSNSFAKLHGCNVEGQVYYSRLMKATFNELVQIESQDTQDMTYMYLEKYFSKDAVLKSKCISDRSDA